GHVFVLDPGQYLYQGSVSELDARTGAVLHAIPVGIDPRGVAVDDQADRALVVSAKGMDHVSQGQWVQWAHTLRHWLPWLPASKPAPNKGDGTVSVLDSMR
ncbi:MAG: hypothetical protein LC769_10545, partial [Chloroflexi bacterium]|nr:hypothetical protein [Chloroflexota bacterium]